MILLLSYAAVNVIIGPVFSVRAILPRIILSVLLYNVAYGLLAFPYWLASVFNYLRINVFFHVLAIILFSEGVFYCFRWKPYGPGRTTKDPLT